VRAQDTDAAIALAKEASALLEGSDETNEDAPKRFMETRVARRYRATLRDAAKVHDAHSKPLTTAYQGD